MRYLKNSIYLALLLSFVFLIGCLSKPTSSIPKTNIEEELINSFNKTTKLQYPLYINTKIAGKTFWVYIATQKELLTINTASSIGGVIPEKIIKFLDITCQYDDSTFNLNYIFLKYSPEEKAKELDLFRKSVGGTSLYQDFTDTTI